MIPSLETVYRAMSVGQLPAVWASKSYPSLKPLGGYVTDLLQRLQFMQDWIDHGEPDVFWLSGLYFTQSFITGVLQNHSRKHKLQIDLVTIKFDVTAFEVEVGNQPEVGVFVKVCERFLWWDLCNSIETQYYIILCCIIRTNELNARILSHSM